MLHWLAANLLVIVHLAFVVFVLFGGFLVLKWRSAAWLHIPAAVWGALIEFRGWICPLTPLEQYLRAAGGREGYSGGFIEHYLLPVLYPPALTTDLQLVLGSLVVLINVAVYGRVFYRIRRGEHGRIG